MKIVLRQLKTITRKKLLEFLAMANDGLRKHWERIQALKSL